jgi:glycosyltransferase involved in cell wall biosynthesis
VSALFFFPRGGSAQVTRSLCRSLPRTGWRASVVAGSLGAAGEQTHARTFFSGLDVTPVDYTAAAALPDPLAAEVPFQPSYEDRPGAPDRVFAAVGDEPYERLVRAWKGALAAGGAADATLLHLHHLTPIDEAAAQAFPHVPVLTQLHGTELAMLREIDAGPPRGWTHAAQWADRMRTWARAASHTLVPPGDEEDVAALLGLERDAVTGLPSGVELDRFERRPLAPEERHAFWRRWLVEDARGWDESGVPGTVAYRDAELEPFRAGVPVVLYVGRYTRVKRLPMLIRAHARATDRLGTRVALVLLGGHPGEWEGEHPLRVVRETAARDVFLAGWRPHDELAGAMNAADVVVLPSVHEAFGLVLVEAMACGLPVIAADAHGPADIVDDRETGWLVPPDDEEALVQALVAAAGDADERARRGALAYERSRAAYGWDAIAARIAGLYAHVAASRRAAPATGAARVDP